MDVTPEAATPEAPIKVENSPPPMERGDQRRRMSQEELEMVRRRLGECLYIMIIVISNP